MAKRSAPRIGDQIADSIIAALAEQIVIVPGAEKSNFVLNTLARQLSEVRRARAELEEQFESELNRHQAGPILTSMPGVGVRIAATILVEVVDIDRFDSAGNLAAYAGVAPRTHRSGTSIRGEHRQRGGSTRLERAIRDVEDMFGVRTARRESQSTGYRGSLSDRRQRCSCGSSAHR
ncbi:hypothetical protein CH272_11990 [Rhodococcus sp. 05-340-1]|uniref:transposase n=1 Tax=Rhodococcus sp. 05-340-1 TaxID=2022505 RepID=UPI000B9A209E|nr:MULTISPECIES: transposase [unclassified Rhodococcus (in: high G+C Gram-positive bacteria)]OZD62125.1 hypothetical protein CH271_24645 [Rhodococcus sp. 05-340-2]OZD78416.1 hypothetical protein CH272_11990 [Rhodococcus sp. 05-340-1]